MSDMKVQMTLELKTKIDEANAAKTALEGIKKAIDDTSKSFETVISHVNDFISKLKEINSIKIDIKLPDKQVIVTPVLNAKPMGSINEQLNKIPPPIITPQINSVKTLDQLRDLQNNIKREMSLLKAQDINAKITLNTEDYKVKRTEIQKEMLLLKEQKINVDLKIDDAKQSMTDFSKFTNSIFGKITLGNLLASGIEFGINMAVEGVKKIADILKNSLETMKQYETSLKGLDFASRSWGQSADKAKDYAKQLALDGLIPLNAASTTLKNLISTGYSLDEAFKLANAMKDIGAFNNIVGDLGEAMTTSSQGLRNNSIEMIDNIGFTQRLSNVLKSYGLDISQGISLTDNQSQRMAVLNAFLREQTKNIGAASEYTKTYAGTQEQANSAIKNMQEAMGKLIQTPAKGFQNFIITTTSLIKNLADEIDKIKKSEDIGYRIESLGGLSKAPIEELKKARKELEDYFKNIDSKSTPQQIVSSREAMASEDPSYMRELRKRKELLEDINLTLAKQARITGQTTDLRKDEIQRQKEALELNKFYEDIKNKINEIKKRNLDLGKTQEEISKSQSTYLESELEKLDTKSEKYKTILSMYNKSKTQEFKIDTTVKFNVDEEVEKQFQKQWGDVIKLKEKINAIQSEWENKPPVFGWDAVKKSEIGNIDKQIDTVNDAMKSLNITTEEGKNKFQALNQFLNDLKNKKINIEAKFTTTDVTTSGVGSTGIDYGQYYGKIAYDAQKSQDEIEAQKKSLRDRANGVEEADYQDHYLELEKLTEKGLKERSDKEKKAREELTQVHKDIASEITNIGNVLNNDFIKALGNFTQNIFDIQDSLTKYKASSGLGQVAAGLGVVGGIISIGTTLFNLLDKPAEKQLSAAEQMAEAVSKFEESLKDKTAQEAGKELPKLLSTLSSLKESPKATGFLGNAIKVAIETTLKQIDALKDTIKEKLGFTWENLSSSVKSAFDESNLQDFQTSFKKNLTQTIRDSVIEGFLTGDIMKGKFEDLSEDIYSSLRSVKFDVTQLSPEQVAKWKLSIDDASVSAASFKQTLDLIGLGNDDVSESTSDLFEGLFDIDFKETQLNKSIEEMKTNAMEAINLIKTSKTKIYERESEETPGTMIHTNISIESTIGQDIQQLQSDFVTGRISLDQYNQGLDNIYNNPAVKIQIDRVNQLTDQQKQANDELEKQNDILNKTKTSVSEAFKSALNSGKTEDFYSSMGKSIYDNAKEALIKAFSEAPIYQELFKSYFDPQNMPKVTGDVEIDKANAQKYLADLVVTLNALGFKIDLGVEIPKAEMNELYGNVDDFIKQSREKARTAAIAAADVGNVIIGKKTVAQLVDEANKALQSGTINEEQYNQRLTDIYNNPAVKNLTQQWRDATEAEKKATEELEKFNKIQPVIKTIFTGKDDFKTAATKAAVEEGQSKAAEAVGRVKIGDKTVTEIIDEANKALQAGTINATKYGEIMDSIYNNPDVVKIVKPWQDMTEAEKKATEEAEKAKATLEKISTAMGSALDKFMETGDKFDFSQSLGQSLYDNIYSNVKEAFTKAFSEAGLYKQIFDSYMKEHPIDFTGLTAKEAISKAKEYMVGVDDWLRSEGLDRTSINLGKTSAETSTISGTATQQMSMSLQGASITKNYIITLSNNEIYNDSYEGVVKKVFNEIEKQEGADI